MYWCIKSIPLLGDNLNGKLEFTCIICINSFNVALLMLSVKHVVNCPVAHSEKKNKETRLDGFDMKGLRKILLVLWTAKKTNKWVLNKAGVKRDFRYCQSTEASILWSHHEETSELPGGRDNARNNARCTQARKTSHDLDGQHQYVDRTIHGRVNQNDRRQR